MLCISFAYYRGKQVIIHFRSNALCLKEALPHHQEAASRLNSPIDPNPRHTIPGRSTVVAAAVTLVSSLIALALSRHGSVPPTASYAASLLVTLAATSVTTYLIDGRALRPLPPSTGNAACGASPARWAFVFNQEAFDESERYQGPGHLHAVHTR